MVGLLRRRAAPRGRSYPWDGAGAAFSTSPFGRHSVGGRWCHVPMRWDTQVTDWLDDVLAAVRATGLADLVEATVAGVWERNVDRYDPVVAGDTATSLGITASENIRTLLLRTGADEWAARGVVVTSVQQALVLRVGVRRVLLMKVADRRLDPGEADGHDWSGIRWDAASDVRRLAAEDNAARYEPAVADQTGRSVVARPRARCRRRPRSSPPSRAGLGGRSGVRDDGGLARCAVRGPTRHAAVARRRAGLAPRARRRPAPAGARGRRAEGAGRPWLSQLAASGVRRSEAANGGRSSTRSDSRPAPRQAGRRRRGPRRSPGCPSPAGPRSSARASASRPGRRPAATAAG